MEYRNGRVFVTCPKCKGIGGPFRLDGTQLICSECKNSGYLAKPLSEAINEIQEEAIKTYRANVITSLREIQTKAFMREALETYIEQLMEESRNG